MEINEILQDFRRRYEHTLIWVQPPDSSEESLFMVDRITPDASKVAVVHLSSPEYGKIVLNMGTAHTLRFKYPPVGVFQHKHDAYIFRRVPAKQYKHGLCAGNSSFYPVTKSFNRPAGVPAELPFEVVLDAYNTVQYSFKDALKMLASGKYRSVALRDNYSLSLSPTALTGYVLLFWETPLAWIGTDGTTSNILEKAFEMQIEKVKGQ